jgi:high-affinity K+ transport system ATPase subunit B
MFMGVFPAMDQLNIMALAAPRTAILSAVTAWKDVAVLILPSKAAEIECSRLGLVWSRG